MSHPWRRSRCSHRGSVSRRHQTAAVSRCLRRSRRFHLCRRSVDRVDAGRHCHSPDCGSGARAVGAVFARLAPHRIHRRIRRRRSGLRDRRHGGEPKQLTCYPAHGPMPQRWGFDNQVYGWTPDGKSVLFRSWRESISESNPRLYTVSVDGGLPAALPMPVAGVGRYSPDGKQIVYSPKFRDFRTWNRYVGGWAQDLYIYDFAAKSAKNITNDPNTDRDPVWIGNAIYFLADRGEHLNLYRYDVAERRDQAAHRLQGLRRALGKRRRQGPDRVRGRRRAARLRHERESGSRARHHRAERSGAHARRGAQRQGQGRGFRAERERQARAVHRARRCVQRAAQGRHHARSHPHAGCARARGGVVARTASASPTCRTKAARKRSGCATPTAAMRMQLDQRKVRPPVRAALVARMDRASRSSTATAVCIVAASAADRRRSSPTIRASHAATTPGRRAATTSPTR